MTRTRHYARTVFMLAAMLLCANSLMRGQFAGADQNGAAKLTQFTGQISYMKGSDLWVLNLGDTVYPQQVIVTGADGYGLFQLADGSTFEVFPKSKVVFRANRGDWRDLLEVILGKIRVQIEHPGGLPNNNKVRTPTAVISVRGTVFDVDVEDEDGTTMVLDEEGQVEVRHLLRAGNVAVLNPMEYIRIYKNEPIARKLIDKGGLLQRALRIASEVLYEAAAEHGGTLGHGATTCPPTLPCDRNGGNPPPPPPPPPPPAPSH
jgi:FecR protein